MEELIDELLNLDDVKAVRRQGDTVLKIELFTREIPGSEAVDIDTDLRSLTPKIKARLDSARDRDEIRGWEWIERPEKKYQERSLGGVSDRKSKGYKPGYYLVSIGN